MRTRERKRGKCPTCCPSGGAIFVRTADFGDNSGEWIHYWACTNCGHRKPSGKRFESKANVDKAVARIRAAVETSGSDKFPVIIDEWEVKPDSHGGFYLMVRAHQGEGENLLTCISSRMLGVHISPAGGIRVFSDSKHGSKKDLASASKQLRRGRLYCW